MSVLYCGADLLYQLDWDQTKLNPDDDYNVRDMYEVNLFDNRIFKDATRNYSYDELKIFRKKNSRRRG